ncbi:cytochrome C oxidase subunit IV family protein [Castellaniella defragrans]|uniref:Heme/copper-type cytochrome/quinol oxidase subunit 4 n=1 Tax=Castellaniella defragrans TaxID=75697 RepID=A0A7W9WNB5_CASDE|nr:cytochrome C oxidase subunit IV family protein [Castellaniella defragrans]KAB0622746.1 cytochrome C oxidase subunit IV family protein [Castellaniella defragrans]MBB6085237.1 heme/copper-type cytochrome/quinol oxidase subunit 4 [Castellaniella defragrans]
MNTHSSLRPAVLVFLFLVGATLGSVWLAGHQAFGGPWTPVFVMLVAFVKGRMIMRHFMELARAPLAWSATFEIWGIATTAVIAGLWIMTATGG